LGNTGTLSNVNTDAHDNFLTFPWVSQPFSNPNLENPLEQFSDADLSPSITVPRTKALRLELTVPGAVSGNIRDSPEPEIPDVGMSPTGKISTQTRKAEHRECLKWNHTLSSDLKPYETIKDPKDPPNVGRRKGPLDPEVRKNAREMRAIHSCFWCRIMKTKVGRPNYQAMQTC